MQRWERTYWVVFAANLITAVGMMSFLPFFPAYLRELGVSDEGAVRAWTGVVFGAAPLSAAVMGPLWGAIGDRYGRKAMVLRALLSITLFVGCMGWVRTPWQLLALRLGQGVFSGYVPPSITLVSVAAPRGVQGRVAGSLQAALAGGSILGPLVGAWVQDSYGLRTVFLGVAVASAFSALLVWRFAHEEEGMRATLEGFSPTAVLSGLAGDMREILARPRIRAAVCILFALQIGAGSTTPQLYLFVEELGVRASVVEAHTAWLMTGFHTAALLTTAAWGRLADRRGHGRVLAGAALATGLVLLLHGFARTYPALLLFRVLLGVVATGANAAAFGVAAVESRAHQRGGAMGAVFSARTLAVSAGAMGGGALAGVYGIRNLFLVAGVLVLTTVSFLVHRTLRARRVAVE